MAEEQVGVSQQQPRRDAIDFGPWVVRTASKYRAAGGEAGESPGGRECPVALSETGGDELPSQPPPVREEVEEEKGKTFSRS